MTSLGPNGAWTNFVKALRKHDHHVIQGWKEDVDSLLVFAGLFSAVVTAFNIEAYKLLQEDPDEKTASLLTQISAQLDNNNDSARRALPVATFSPDARAVRINILWFSSLVLSLFSASVGILMKQWLREYTRYAANSPRENARIRQLRHDGLARWKVPLIIALLPFLLQVAMALFFAGLLDLLWSLHQTVASIITVLVVGALSFLMYTTVTPTFSGDCPYKSQQALALYLLVQGLARILSLLASQVYAALGWDRPQFPLILNPSLFRRWRRRVAGWLVQMKHQRHFTSWREREMAIIHDSAVSLDHRVLVQADATFREDDFLWETIGSCLRDTECAVALGSLNEIVTHRADLVVDGAPFWRHRDTGDGGVNMLLHLVLDVLLRMDQADHGNMEKTLSLADSLCWAIPFEKEQMETAILYQRLFDALARLLATGESVRVSAFGLMQKMWARSSAPVRPRVVQELISFARRAKQSGDFHVFHTACEMVLAFSTTPTFPAHAFDSIRNELAHLFSDLESYLAAQDALGSDVLGSGQSASIFLALAELDAREPALVRGAKLRRLVDEVRGCGAQQAESRSWRQHLAHARQLREYRELHPHASMTRRRNATMYRATVLDFSCPATPTSPGTRSEPPELSAVQSSTIHEDAPEMSSVRIESTSAGSSVLRRLDLDIQSIRSRTM
ncbi:hypothetical protein BD413DRAFT_492204 [Trametes elegans]|nr:hypothetical protein BD413DRAFT_492204 [Trametes elegans]